MGRTTHTLALRARGFRVQRWGVLALGLSLLAAGCGPRLAKVGGTVTYQGKPVEGAQIMFVPRGGGGRPGYATTDSEGRFQVLTIEQGRRHGALVGEHVVTVSKSVQATGKAPPPRSTAENVPEDEGLRFTVLKELLPEKYRSAVTSPLSVTVEAGKQNDFPLELTD